jgi:hypothetical protein
MGRGPKAPMAAGLSSGETREHLRGCGGGVGGAHAGGETTRIELRVSPRREGVERARAERARDEPAREPPTWPPAPSGAAAAEQAAAAAASPARPASSSVHPYAPEEGASSLSLTLEEAKRAIRAAGGDVIQVGFLARAYLREREEESESAETAAARERLCALVVKRLKDRKLLAPDGRFELLA